MVSDLWYHSLTNSVSPLTLGVWARTTPAKILSPLNRENHPQRKRCHFDQGVWVRATLTGFEGDFEGIPLKTRVISDQSVWAIIITQTSFQV